MPIRKDNEVQVVCGQYKRQQVGKGFHCYRKKFVDNIERIQREKTSGASVCVCFHPSQVYVVKLKIDKGRKEILERRAKGSVDPGRSEGRHLQRCCRLEAWADEIQAAGADQRGQTKGFCPQEKVVRVSHLGGGGPNCCPSSQSLH